MLIFGVLVLCRRGLGLVFFVGGGGLKLESGGLKYAISNRGKGRCNF